MPKPVRELLEQQRPLVDRIMEVLRRHPDSAFTVDEIAARVEAGSNSDSVVLYEFIISSRPPDERQRVLRSWQEALTLLVQQGSVRELRDESRVYYACVSPR